MSENRGESLFDEETIFIVRETWKKININPAETGKLIFLKLFKAHPSYQSRFAKLADVPYLELVDNKDFLRHANAVAGKLHVAVQSLHNADMLTKHLLPIGKRHIPYNLSEEHFRNVQVIIESVIEEVLAKEYNKDIQKAWNAVLSVVIFTIMKEAKIIT